jgi:O-antigen ligase
MNPSSAFLAAPAQGNARLVNAARWSAIAAICTVMISPPLANVAMALMLILLLASGQAGARLRHACSQPLGVATLLLIGVIAVAMLWAPVPWNDRWASFWSWRKVWMIPLALALFGPSLWKRRLVVAYVAVCAAAVLVSFGAVLVAGRLPTTVYDFAGSMLRNHSAQSMAFAVAAFFALWLGAEAQLARRWRLTAAGFAALFVLNMVFVTPGRSGLLALGVMLLVLAAFHVRSRRTALAAVVLAVLLGGAMLLSPLARDRLELAAREWREAPTATVKTSMGIRAVLYENTLELVRERPWLGTGTGGYGAAYERHVRAKYGADDWRMLPTVDPHSQYLFFLAEQGILGLAAFVLFIVLALADRGDGSRARVLAVGMLLGWCATSLLSSHFKTFSEGFMLSLILGTMLARPVRGLDPPASAAA